MGFSSNDFDESLKGHLLVAGSALSDPIFSESVVFILEHQEGGAFGLVLNKKTEVLLDDFLQMPRVKNPTSFVYQGGPVRSEILFVLHELTEYEEEDSEVMPGLFLGRSRELLDTLMEKNLPFRVYSGYAGWEPFQLEKEIRMNSWLTIPADIKNIFSNDPEKLWRKLLFKMGGICRYYSKMVKEPSLN